MRDVVSSKLQSLTRTPQPPVTQSPQRLSTADSGMMMRPLPSYSARATPRHKDQSVAIASPPPPPAITQQAPALQSPSGSDSKQALRASHKDSAQSAAEMSPAASASSAIRQSPTLKDSASSSHMTRLQAMLVKPSSASPVKRKERQTQSKSAADTATSRPLLALSPPPASVQSAIVSAKSHLSPAQQVLDAKAQASFDTNWAAKRSQALALAMGLETPKLKSKPRASPPPPHPPPRASK